MNWLRTNPRRLVVVLAALLVATAGAVAVRAATGGSAPRSAPPAVVHAYPQPGSIAAAPHTRISLRGRPARQLGNVQVQGSESGAHPGRLVDTRDGKGAIFIPASPFKPGERVTVRTDVPVAGASDGAFTFVVAHLANPPKPASSQTSQEPQTPVKNLSYRSRPDLHPPAVHVTRTGAAFDGLIASTPGQHELLLSDDSGEPVWVKAAAPGHSVGDLKVRTLNGERVLVYFEGTGGFGPGNYRGSWHLLDASYREVATISAGNGAQADIHDLLLRPDGTAIVECYTPVIMDLRRYGGSSRATVLDSQIQQIDIATGDVWFDWHSLDHLPPSESYEDLDGKVVDYIHANGVAADPSDPDLVVVSARHLSQVFALNLKTGKIAWRVGGKHPTLRFADGAKDTLRVDGQRLPFSYQHDARLQPDGILTVFDNGNQRKPAFSRAAAFHLDLAAGTVTQDDAATIRHQPDLYGRATGDARRLPNGDTLVSWGTTGKATEYDRQGRPVAEIQSLRTYRMVKATWQATPATAPAVVAQSSGASVVVYASWNGATEVASWQVLAGPSPGDLHAVATARRTGFETEISLPPAGSSSLDYVQVRARDSAGKVLATSVVAPTVQS